MRPRNRDLRRSRLAVRRSGLRGAALLAGALGAAVVVVVAAAGGEAAGAQADRGPYGRLDPPRVVGPGAVQIGGWAIDPDTRGPIKVIVSANGRLAGGRAASVRRDLSRANNRHGYSFVISGLRPGPTQVCAGAFNVGPGPAGRLVGCALVNTGGSNPLGAIDAVAPTSTTTATVNGWALDPDTPFPTPFDVVVDGVVAGRGVARDARGDIAAFFPGWTEWHGYSQAITVAEGTHQICLRPQNLGPGRTVDVACTIYATPDVHPTGGLESVSVEGGNIVVTGWAFERDQPGAPAVVTAFDDPGPGDPTRVTASPDMDRPDVAAVVGRAGRFGYRIVWTPTRGGVHTVCAAAANRGWGSDRLLGCRTVEVVDGRPWGSIDSLQPAASSVSVTGWAADPGGSGPLAVRVTTDRAATSVTSTASITRPDVVRPDGTVGGSIGYAVTLNGLAAGAHRICVEAIDGAGPPGALAGNQRWCGAALVGPTRMSVLESGAEEAAVGPAAGTVLADVERDGGVSTRLSDGSVLWLFGDSSARNPDGSLRYFVSGTAAWASAASPTLTRDGAVDGRPVAAAVPGPGFPACPPQRPTAALWPLAAVTVPDGATDRVIAWFANMCLSSEPSFQAMGTSVGEWRYDPADPPVDRAVQFSITNQSLWSDIGPGESAIVDDLGQIVTYHCDGPDDGGWFTEYGPCVVARVDPDEVTDPAAYRFWDGSGFNAARAAAVPMSLPASGEAGIGTYPASAFTIARDAAVGRYVMAYTSWPGFTGTTWIRVASSPTGPWSEALRVDVASCPITIGGSMLSCYASTAQPVFSGTGRLGLGVFRQWLADDPRRSSYRAVRLRMSPPS